MGYCAGQILIQFAIGFSGSLLAGILIATASERRFNRAIKVSERSIISSIEPLNTTTVSIARDIKSLEVLSITTSAIAKDIKRLAELVDRFREGEEKKE